MDDRREVLFADGPVAGMQISVNPQTLHSDAFPFPPARLKVPYRVPGSVGGFGSIEYTRIAEVAGVVVYRLEPLDG